MKKLYRQLCNIFWLMKPYWKYGKFYVFISVFFWVAVVPATRILTVLFPAQVVSSLDSGRPFGQILAIIVGFQLVFLAIPLFEDMYINFIRNRTDKKIELKIKRSVYLKALKTDYKYIDDPEYYDKYQWAIEQHARQAGEAFSLINEFLSAVVVIASLVGIIASNNPLIVLLCVVGMVIRTYAAMRYNKVELDMESEQVPVQRRLNYYHRLFYMRDYSADMKSTSLKDYVLKNYDDASEKNVSLIVRFGRRFFGWSSFSDIVYRVIMTSCILLIVYNIYIGNIIGSATYLTIMLSIERLDNYMFEVFDLVKSANRLGMYGEKIRDFYAIESTIETDTGTDKAEPEPGAFSVDFKNTDFSYKNSDFHINDFNVHIGAGEKIAIVGKNGVGKSTLVKLLMRFYDVDGGSIEINGKNIREYDIEKLRKRIGVAFQNSNYYAMSFAENIGLYGGVDEETLEKVIQKADLKRVLEKNNADPTTEVTKEFDENGIVLSGGEAQKLAIARLFTSDFGLLIFDEPSSALDPLAEYEMTKLILDGSNLATTIIVAHRLSTIRDVDKIILVDSGSIKEIGTHDELMDLGGEYCEMFTKQAENYNK